MKFKLLSEKRRKKRYNIKIDAGNVPYNVGVFNAMNNASESPSTNPTGPMGESKENETNRKV